ncbi:ubiquitin carboxyl-terminal hydrolase 10 isoform X2 [Ischnura elegans]|uniref:ubiquitin carboxyl-terminal hydrolase 10 isoform X2 n=1 Tax=Ischnura elegans TaxID=197161 RepID=UPI001ED899D1|nr:ubiquitin carboxyl-terminal hydrolase 10 isoform X2 [Ischnura elegans]
MDTIIQEFEFLDLENTNEKERNHLHQVLFAQPPGKSPEFPWLNNEGTCTAKGWTPANYAMNGPAEVVMPVEQEIPQLSPQFTSQTPITIPHIPQATAYASNPEPQNHAVVVPTTPTTSVPPPNACPAAMYPTMQPPPGAFHHHQHHARHQSPLGSPHYAVDVDPNGPVDASGSGSHRGSIGSQGSDRPRRGRGKGKRDDRHSIPSPESMNPVQTAYMHPPHAPFITYTPYPTHYYPPHQPPPPTQSNVAAAQHATGTPLYLAPAPVQMYTTPIYGAYVPAHPPHHHHHHHQSPPEAQQELQPPPNEHFQQTDSQQSLEHGIVEHSMQHHFEHVEMHCQELPTERPIVSDLKNEPLYDSQVHPTPQQQQVEALDPELVPEDPALGSQVDTKGVNVDCGIRTQAEQVPLSSECHTTQPPAPLPAEPSHPVAAAAPLTQTIVPVVVRTVPSTVEHQIVAQPPKEEPVAPKAVTAATEGAVEPNAPRTSMSPSFTTSPTFPAEMNANFPEIQTPTPAQPAPPEVGRSWASLFTPKQTASTNSHSPSSVASPGDIGHQGAKLMGRMGPFTSPTNEESSSSVPSVGKLPRSSPMIDDPVSYRLGEHLLQYDLEYTTTPLQPRGLTNRGNWCYVNATLQALLACPPFFNLLKSLPLTVGSNSKSPTPITSAMVELVNEFEVLPAATMGLFGRMPKREKLQRARAAEDAALGSSPISSTMHEVPCGPAFEPSYIYRMMNGIRSGDAFKVEGRQEDAEEFLGCLLNGLNDEMLEAMKLVEDTSKAQGLTNGEVVPAAPLSPVSEPDSSDGNEWKIMGPKNKGSVTRHADFGRTPLSDIFRGQLRSRVQRLGDTTTDNVQPFFTLQLDIEKAQSVKDAMELLVGRDQLEGLTSLKTHREVEAWQQVTLEELPPVLILHLKWFDYKLDGCSKIVKSVEFMVDLKVDGKLMSANKTKYGVKQKHYKLFAVVYHDGNEATKGHYITDAYHQGLGGWIRYDDSSVRGVSEAAVLKPKAPRVPYLLYYRRADTIGRGASSSSNSEKPR